MTVGITALPSPGIVDDSERAQVVTNFQSVLTSAGADVTTAQNLAAALDSYLVATPSAGYAGASAYAAALAQTDLVPGGAAAEASLIGQIIGNDVFAADLDIPIEVAIGIANQDDPNASSFLGNFLAISSNMTRSNVETQETIQLSNLLFQSRQQPF